MTKAEKKERPQSEIIDCGIIMPISSIEDCPDKHWLEVKGIIDDCIHDAGFRPFLVSSSDDVGVIQKRIVQNLYENPVVVCDVSCKNPNVMFELGMRLAFDKPTIIIKDDKTEYSFDTSSIEHIEYPRDLRFNSIIDFKEKLTSKISATYEKSQNDSSYTTFLKHYGTFKVAKLDTEEVSQEQFLAEEIKELKRMVSRLNYGDSSRNQNSFFGGGTAISQGLLGKSYLNEYGRERIMKEAIQRVCMKLFGQTQLSKNKAKDYKSDILDMVVEDSEVLSTFDTYKDAESQFTDVYKRMYGN